MSAPSHLDAFLGTWRLDRTIEDRRAGQTLSFAGLAKVTKTPEGATYWEGGVLTLPNGPLHGERRYHWAPVEHGVAVFFEDGRTFHSFSFRAAEADHLCGDDLYRVTYDFAQWPKWTATWRVEGPRKNYTSVSRYQPE